MQTLFSFSSPWSYWLFFLAVAWPLAWLGHAAVSRARPDLVARDWPWHRLLGLSLVLWPFVKHAYNVWNSFALVLDTDSVVGTTPAWVWWVTIERRWWQYVALPLVGLFLMFGHHLQSATPMGTRIRRTLAAVSIWPRTSWTRDIVNGFGIFVIAYIAYVAIAIGLAPLRRLDTGDESGVFDAIDPTLAFALALTAGVTEEIIFRGILQNGLKRFMPLGVAIAIQSVFFGLIHSGYGTLSHIILPAIFGVAMGIVMERFGLVPAILIHALVDLVIFLAITAGNGYDWTLVVIPFVFLAGIALPAAYYITEWWHRRDEGGSGDPDGDAEWARVDA